MGLCMIVQYVNDVPVVTVIVMYRNRPCISRIFISIILRPKVMVHLNTLFDNLLINLKLFALKQVPSGFQSGHSNSSLSEQSTVSLVGSH